ncbi:MAG: heavy-metal-associated domain-containing protein [Bacteroidales bacterium]|nr:heavy-metal-associated domain-containing protein [Bacteroidales bacterium]
MKITYLISIVVFFSSTLISVAQEKNEKIETAEFHVSGVCDQCKTRIENAALIKGVKLAEWNKETHNIKVVFNNTKTSEEDIHSAIAEHGHDTELVKADDAIYGKLPKCCAYRDGLKAH